MKTQVFNSGFRDGFILFVKQADELSRRAAERLERQQQQLDAGKPTTFSGRDREVAHNVVPDKPIEAPWDPYESDRLAGGGFEWNSPSAVQARERMPSLLEGADRGITSVVQGQLDKRVKPWVDQQANNQREQTAKWARGLGGEAMSALGNAGKSVGNWFTDTGKNISGGLSTLVSDASKAHAKAVAEEEAAHERQRKEYGDWLSTGWNTASSGLRSAWDTAASGAKSVYGGTKDLINTASEAAKPVVKELSEVNANFNKYSPLLDRMSSASDILSQLGNWFTANPGLALGGGAALLGGGGLLASMLMGGGGQPQQGYYGPPPQYRYTGGPYNPNAIDAYGQ